MSPKSDKKRKTEEDGSGRLPIESKRLSKRVKSNEEEISKVVKQDSDEQQGESVEKSAPKARRKLASTKHLVVREIAGDLFKSPKNSILVHACNCQGLWGAGIAAAFRRNYPTAHQLYVAHCKKHKQDLLGCCLLIAPQDQSKSNVERESRHWIGCLFTSDGKGRNKGSTESILEATDKAIRDLIQQIRDHNDTPKSRFTDIKMCKINSGIFAVPWTDTKRIIEAISIEEEDIQDIEVISRDET